MISLQENDFLPTQNHLSRSRFISVLGAMEVFGDDTNEPDERKTILVPAKNLKSMRLWLDSDINSGDTLTITVQRQRGSSAAVTVLNSANIVVDDDGSGTNIDGNAGYTDLSDHINRGVSVEAGDILRISIAHAGSGTPNYGLLIQPE